MADNQLLAMVNYIERENGVDREIVLTAIEQAIQQAARRNPGVTNDLRVVIDRKTITLRVFDTMVVSDEDTGTGFISVARAQRLDPTKQEGDTITVTRPNDEKLNRSLHGLTRTLLNNMIVGVTEGYKKELEVNGVGYRVAKDGNKLVMNIGFSHQVIMEEKNGVTIEVPAPNKIIVSGIDKQSVGQFAAEVREKRPPEPYKGKGIRYAGEVVRRKEGKTGGKKK